MLMVSISCTSARPMPTATASARICGSSASRSSGVSCLESLTPWMRAPGLRMTAAGAGPGLGEAGGGTPRPRQRRHAHLVAAAHQGEALVPERLLEGAEPGEAPAFRLRLGVAL